MDDPQAMIGMEVGERYVLRAVLGRGASAVVFRASDAVRGGEVALKLYGTEEFDAQTAEAASHFPVSDSNAVLQLWDAHTTLLEGPATAMPIMECTLEDQGRVLTLAAVHYTRRVLTALECCHGRGVVHGDVKPANVFFDRDQNVLLGDFGAAKRTAEYASPERTAGQRKAATDDLWATAVMFYEMLVQELPFGCRPDLTEQEIGEAILAGQFREPGRVRPYLPLKFKRFFEQAFAANLQARFATAADMRLALRDLAVNVEWFSVYAPPGDKVFEGNEIRPDGTFTGVRYRASLTTLKDGQWQARVDKAAAGGAFRKLTRLDPFVGTQAGAGQRLQTWMRQLTEHGRLLAS